MHKQRGSHFRFTAWKPLESPASAIHLQDPFRRARRTPGKNSLPGSRCPSVHGRSGHRARTPGHGVHRHTRRCRRTCGRIQEGSPGMRVRHDGTAYSRPSTSPGGHSFHPLVSWTSRNPVPCEENLPGVEDFAQICRQARIDGYPDQAFHPRERSQFVSEPSCTPKNRPRRSIRPVCSRGRLPCLPLISHP